jgi:PAS domain S-box-containing protein
METLTLPFDTDLIVPMRLALGGDLGAIVGPDYRGVTVVAAYAPLLGGRLGLVTKMDLQEIAAPFVRAAIGVFVAAVLLGLFWASAVRGSTRPLLAAQALTDSQVLLLANAVANLSESVVVTGRDGQIEFVNPAFTRISGYSIEEVQGKTPRLLRSGLQDRAFYENLWSTILSGHVWRGVMTNRAKDQREYQIEATISPVRDRHGEITHFIGIQADVSDRVRQAAELRESEARYRSLVEGSAQGILIVQDGQIVFSNREIARWVADGDPAALLGKKAIDLVAPEDRERVDAFRRSLLAGGPEARSLEYRVVADNGEVIWVESFAQPILWRGRPALQTTLIDVTKVRRLEEQLSQAQRLESVGRLAGGVAHDFNNILTVISSYIGFILDELALDSSLHEDATVVRDASRRAADLTRQLLAFSRRQILEMRTVSVNDVVAGLEKMVTRLIGEDIQVVSILDPGVRPIRADVSQIEQVIMNLAVNSRDAMPRGGVITIETANQSLDEHYAGTHAGIRPGEYVMLAVTDVGTGMDKETQQHIFEPFFTTKPQGKGTGLGLATVYGIVKQMNGSIFVYSELGKGTTFKIYFPVSEHGAAQSQEAPLAEVSKQHAETILLVEDDELVRRSAERILQGAGYQVIAATGSEQAIGIARDRARSIDLLLSDVVMPGMSGGEMYEEIRKNRDVRVVFMSGYTDDTVVRHGILEGNVPFLTKPFTKQSLLVKVREAIARGV